MNTSPDATVAADADDARAFAPRPLTEHARRRLWAEPSVRGWWLTALLLLGVIAYLVVEQLLIGRTSAYRLSHWTPVTAIVEKIEAGGHGDYSTRRTYSLSLEDVRSKEVVLTYLDAAGQPHTSGGYLTGVTRVQEPKRPQPPGPAKAGQEDPARYVHPGSLVQVLIDPDHPQRWTDRTQPEPLAEQLLVPLIPSPLLLVLLVGLWVQRRRLRRLVQTGVTRDATVIGTTRSAAAPRSAIVRCTVNDARDKRVIRVTVPRSVAELEPGDVIRVITPAGDDVTPALAAAVYE